MSTRTVLIVEDDEAVGLNLVAAAEDVGATAIGPIGSVSEALDRLEAGGIDGAVIDVRLQDRDVAPVAMRLIEKGVPFIIHSGYALPDDLAAKYLEPKVVLKPADPEKVINDVLGLISSARKLSEPSKQALSMMLSALAMLDGEHEKAAAAHLQWAIEILTNGEGTE